MSKSAYTNILLNTQQASSLHRLLYETQKVKQWRSIPHIRGKYPLDSISSRVVSVLVEGDNCNGYLASPICNMDFWQTTRLHVASCCDANKMMSKVSKRQIVGKQRGPLPGSQRRGVGGVGQLDQAENQRGRVEGGQGDSNPADPQMWISTLLSARQMECDKPRHSHIFVWTHKYVWHMDMGPSVTFSYNFMRERV